MMHSHRREYQLKRITRLALALVAVTLLGSLTLPRLVTAGFMSLRSLTRSHAMAMGQTPETEQQISAVNPNAPVPGCVQPPAGLVSWWPFDGNGLDFYLNHNAGLGGNPAFVPGQVAQALNFDNVDDSAVVIGGSASSLNVGAGDGFTIDMWINPSDLSVQRPLVEWNNEAGLFGVHLWQSVTCCGAQGPGNLYANIVDTNGVSHIISSPRDTLDEIPNTYQHVALVYEKSFSVAILYVNGNIVASEGFGAVFTPQTTYNLWFGFRPTGAGAGTRFVGQMDEIEIFSRALSQFEIQAIHNAGSAGKCKTRYVTNTNNSGAGSLRQTITDSNNYPGPDTINFNIDGSGVHTITPTSPFGQLPDITGLVAIDGTTQPGYAGAPLIELRGNGGSGTVGLSCVAPVTVRGLAINRFGEGIHLAGGSTIVGNYIGTNATGSVALANGVGIKINSSSDNQIGGLTPAERNVISGNTFEGIRIENSSQNLVQGNYIGTNAAGNAPLGNGFSGIDLSAGSNNNTIGGTSGTTPGGRCTGACNVISGNGGDGISTTGGVVTLNTIQGNFIGTDVTGTLDLGNSRSGVQNFGSNNTIGGTSGTTPGGRCTGACNVISGNGVNGIQIQSLGNIIQGNYIGTDVTGTQQIGNSQQGILLSGGSSSNIIGGTTLAARNVISGNFTWGIQIAGSTTTQNVIQGNFIGTNAAGTSALGNLIGVVLFGASNNTVGGIASGAGNTIAFNNDTGVFVNNNGGPTSRDVIQGNSIFSNGALGIDLLGGMENSFRVTQNDPGDGDSGSNNLQNFPVLNSAISAGGSTNIQGTLNSTPGQSFRIELFANSACDSSGNGEGQTFIGFTNVNTNGIGDGNFSLTVTTASLIGPFITSTATDVNGNTSEFSQCFLATGPPPTPTPTPTPTPMTIQFSASNYPVGEGSQSVDINITRSGNTTGTASVGFATSDAAGAQNCNVVTGVASSRCDYETSIRTVQFAAGETSRTVSLFIIDDSYLEGPETFTVSLSNPSGAPLGSPATATVTITDNEIANGANPVDTASFFVRLHYLDFLNREPDSSGFAFWTNEITSCGANQQCIELKRINVSAAFFLSIEFQETGYLVHRIYKTSYGDAAGMSTFGGAHQLPVPVVRLNEFLPDTQKIGQGVIVGQAGWEQVLEGNKQAFTAEFVQRSRFASALPSTMTPAQFVDALFANAAVTPSATDRQTAIDEFGGAGTSANLAARGRALRRVAENGTLGQQEFNRAFVLMQFFGYLRRNPNDPQDSDYTGYDFWLTKLNQFNGNFVNAEMVKAFITSGEYRQRFGP